MKNRKPLLIAGAVAVALVGVSVVSVFALSNSKMKRIAPQDSEHPYMYENV